MRTTLLAALIAASAPLAGCEPNVDAPPRADSTMSHRMVEGSIRRTPADDLGVVCYYRVGSSPLSCVRTGSR